MNTDSRSRPESPPARPRAPRVAARPRRLRERFRAETRDAILAAAEVALAEHGARGARMEAIAQQAGIAVGTLYNYFADRQQLIEALFELRRRELVEALDRALAASEAEPFEARLEAFLAAGLAHFQAHRAFITLALHEELRGGQGSRWPMQLELRARAERLIAAGLEAGLLRPEDRAAYPHMLIGLLRGLIAAALEGDVAVPRAALAPAVRCFLRGALRSP
ncbi:MAG TPA: TetR/AcrR family transcriptional regulator [Polyangiaceae bacterium]|nr:TetR/AcrR family transcriptional regulator [Polyangiaceae bacterium]